MNKYLLFSFYFICLIFSKNLNGQKSINFLTLDVRSGISDNYIHDILQDEYGFMWFATLNGLNRYDGYHFKRYTTTHIGSHNNNIESVQEDGAGTIWVKTQNELYFYDREKDELINYINKQLEKLDIPGNVANLFIDVDRNLWCSVTNKIHYYQFRS